MAFTFLKAQSLEVGKSLVENDQLDYCRRLELKAVEKGVKLVLPIDVVGSLRNRRFLPRRVL